MHFQVLGPLVVLGDGVELDVRPGRQRLLLACLLAHAGATVPFESLTEALWPGRPRARTDLRPVASRLRRALDAAPDGQGRLLTRSTGYELRARAGELDASTFEDLLARGREAWRANRYDDARDLLGAALDTWRGGAFEDFADSTLLAPTTVRLEELRRTADEDLADVDLALGHESDVAAALVQLVADEPFRERRRAQLMLALYRCGRQAEALRVFREYAGLLVDELGLEPGPRLALLEQQILRQSPALDRTGGTLEGVRARELLEAGRSQRSTGGPYRRTLLEAARAGRAAGDPVVLVEAALAGSRGTYSSLGEVDHERVRLIETALAAASTEPVRARLLAALAAELTFDTSGRRVGAVAARALDAARRSTDPRAEIDVMLACLSSALGDPDAREERHARVREVGALVREHGDLGHRFWLGTIESVCAVERYDADALDAAQGRMNAAADELGEPMASWFAAVSSSTATLLRGDVARARRLSEHAAETGTEIGQRDAPLIHQVQLLHLAWHGGREESMLQAAMRSASSVRPGDPRVAWASALAHRTAAATELLDRAYVADFPSAARVERLTDLCAWAAAAAELGHRSAAERLTTLLRPWSGAVAATGGVVYPCVAHHLGRLAVVRGRPDEARRALHVALEQHRRLRAPFFVRQTLTALAALTPAAVTAG